MLFFDADLARKLPDALALLGLPVTKHDDHFPAGTRDEVWLRAIGERGWVAVTRDQRLWRNASAVQALVDHRVGCIILAGAGSRPRWYAVRILARHWEKIEELMRGEQGPFLCRLRLRQSPEFKRLAAG